MQSQTPLSHQQRPRYPHQQPSQHPHPNPHPHHHSPEAMTAARPPGHAAGHDFIDLTTSLSPSSSSSGCDGRGDNAGFGDDVCFICLDSEGVTRAPCACPMLVHARCMARWQLQRAGSRWAAVSDGAWSGCGCMHTRHALRYMHRHACMTACIGACA
eukprot:365154-Chlamydomonas_euryale.AAC.21